MIPILLTATVNPNGMQGASFSVEERAQMYIEAIRFYVNRASFGKTFSMVFAENSNSIEVVRRAKTSEFIRKSGCFFKVTGRLKVLNIENLLKECSEPGLEFKADCKDHRVYEWLRMPINGHSGECRYWFATSGFFMQTMWKYQERLNDYGEQMFLAEDAMLAVCRETRGQKGCKDRFRTQARISGRGGHNLGKGLSFFYSTDNDSFVLKFKCFVRQLLRWLLPFWKC